MATDWSDDIVIADLSDEPTLSEELTSLLTRLDALASAGALPPPPASDRNRFAGDIP